MIIVYKKYNNKNEGQIMAYGIGSDRKYMDFFVACDKTLTVGYNCLHLPFNFSRHP